MQRDGRRVDAHLHRVARGDCLDEPAVTPQGEMTFGCTAQERLEHLDVITRPDIRRRRERAVADQYGLIGGVEPQGPLDLGRVQAVDKVAQEGGPLLRGDEAAVPVGARVGQRAQVGRRGQAALGEGCGVLPPEHVRQRPGTVAGGAGEAADEAASQPGIAEQRDQRLGVELTARASEVRLEVSERDAEAWIGAVVAQDAGEEPREPVAGRTAGGFTEILRAEGHEILRGERTHREAPGRTGRSGRPARRPPRRG
jgi:hypothetical protein